MGDRDAGRSRGRNLMLRVGLVVNPVAGLGGPAALKGSDGDKIQAQALLSGSKPRALSRCKDMLKALQPRAAEFEFYTGSGALGAELFSDIAFAVTVIETDVRRIDGRLRTSSADTRALVREFVRLGMHLIVFVGGDGTARDVLDAMSNGDTQQADGSAQLARVPVIGIPAGVKMHSGVFATSPRRAAQLLERLSSGALVAAVAAQVRDIDEVALREGRLVARTYGDLLVPQIGGYLQQVKSGGREVEALVLLEIAAEIDESLIGCTQDWVALGPGSSCLALKERYGGGTLLGFDLLRDGCVVQRDVDANALSQVGPNLQVVLSFSRAQGFLLGRGNQQLSPELLRGLGPDRLKVIASRTKIGSLEGRPLLVDSGDANVDKLFTGLTQIVSGYRDYLLYRVEAA